MSKKGTGGEFSHPRSPQPPLFFTEEEGLEALQAAEKELEDDRRKNAYNGHSGGGGVRRRMILCLFVGV